MKQIHPSLRAILLCGAIWTLGAHNSKAQVPDPPNYLEIEVVSEISCNAMSDGSLKVVPQAGQPPYTYSWSNGETTQTAHNLSAGTYSVTVEDNLGRSATIEHTLTQPDVFGLTTGSTAATTCGPEADGTMTVYPSGGTPPYVYSWNPGQETATVEGVGAGNYNVAVTDAHGCFALAEATVDLEDATPPVATAQNLTVYLDDQGYAAIDADAADLGSTDDCSAVDLSVDIGDVDCADIGVQNVVLTATDQAGNTATTNFQATVLDSTPPTLTLRSEVMLYLDDNGTLALTPSDLIDGTADNCGVVAETLSKNTLSCEDIGTLTLSAMAEDASGNFAMAETDVMVVDSIKPTFSLETIALQIDGEGMATLDSDMLMPYAADNCGVAEIAIQTTSFSCANIEGNSSTQIIVFDNHGNLVQTTLNITLEDEQAPVAAADDQTLGLDENGNLTLTPDNVANANTDNCGLGEATFSPAQFNCSETGAHEVTMTVSDLAGNTSTATFTLTVVDDSAPVFDCSQSIYQCAGPLEALMVLATDNCGATTVQTGGPVAGTDLEAGTYTLQYTATDQAGNTAICEVPVTVVDAPIVDLGEDLTVPMGETVVLTAGPDNGTAYLWTTGDTTASIEVEVLEDMTIGVTATAPGGCSSEDEITITLGDPDGTANAVAGQSIAFYPNPTSGNLTMSFDMEGTQNEVSTVLTDVNGRTLRQQHFGATVPGTKHTLHITDLPDGIYMLHVRTENFVRTTKIIKR